jgi:hypothetical protein
MFRYLLTVAALLAAALSLPAATLQQISLDDMTSGATAVVRARVSGASASFTGNTIYTHYRLDVVETWKGRPAAEVMVPGGTASGIRQSFPGVPELAPGSEYVLFLWTSPSTGIVHLVGLNQGVYSVATGSDGVAVASRPQVGELMLNALGQKVKDQAVSMLVADMKSLVTMHLSIGAAR